MVTYGDIDLGVIGISEGNGHPYSFSAIINGYSDTGFEASDWSVIHDYLKEKDESEFGFPGVRVTHAWTQNERETERLCNAAKIPNRASNYADLVDMVDAVMILRDDYETHYEMAMPFLRAGLDVFVDKPLALNAHELRELQPFLEEGQLMSCSGMRYATGLDEARSHPEDYGEIKLAQGVVIKSWERYGIHLLEAIFNAIDRTPVCVTDVGGGHRSAVIELEGGGHVQIDALGDVNDAFDVKLYGTEMTTYHRIEDNFTAFRRTIWRFIEQIRTREPVIPPRETIGLMKILIAGNKSKRTGATIYLDDVTL